MQQVNTCTCVCKTVLTQSAHSRSPTLGVCRKTDCEPTAPACAHAPLFHACGCAQGRVRNTKTGSCMAIPTDMAVPNRGWPEETPDLYAAVVMQACTSYGHAHAHAPAPFTAPNNQTWTLV